MTLAYDERKRHLLLTLMSERQLRCHGLKLEPALEA